MTLVGRDEQLRRLRETRPPCLVYVEGAAGMGKSALISEWLGDTESVYVTACPALEAPLPLAPFVTLLRRTLGQLSDHRTKANPLFGALRTLLPEAGDALPPAPAALGATDADRLRLFRAISAVIAEIAPATLVIEDVHWIDRESRDMVRMLLSEAHPIRVVLSFRPEELALPGRPLGRPGTVSPAPELHTIPLGPLSREQVGSHRLHERTGGVPRLVADLRRSGDSRWMRELVHGRMEALSPVARSVAGAAAVLRSVTDEEYLATVAGLDVDDVRAALRQASRHGVLTEDARFATPFTRETVYRWLDGPTRREMHSRAAQRLSEAPDAAHAELAYHHRQSGNQAAFVEHAEHAVREYVEAGESAAAIELLEQALETAFVPDDVRTRLALELARVAVVGLRSEVTESWLRKILTDDRLPMHARGEIRLDLGLLLCNQIGDTQTGLAEIERAADELVGIPSLAARAYSALAVPYNPLGDLDDTLSWMDRAEQAAERGTDEDIAFAVRATRATIQLLIGDLGPADEVARLAGSDGPTAVSRGQQYARALCNMADIATWLGHNKRAESYLRQGLRVAAEAGAPFHANTGHGTELRLDWALGRWAGLGDRATALVTADSATWATSAEAHLVAGRLALARGDREYATARFRDAGLGDPAFVPAPVLAGAAAGRIRMLLAEDDVQEAAAEADRIWAGMRRKRVWTWVSDSAISMVDALCRSDRPERADELIAEIQDASKPGAAPAVDAALGCCRALLAEHCGRPGDAVGHYREAEQRYAELGQPYDRALAMEGSVRCGLQTGVEPAEQLARLIEALSRFGDLGAASDAARCRGVLREHGITPPASRAGRPGYGDRLSPREHEVATLAAAGRTNREIASSLFLSPRTVEQHVAGALRKLGLRSRNELTGHSF